MSRRGLLLGGLGVGLAAVEGCGAGPADQVGERPERVLSERVGTSETVPLPADAVSVERVNSGGRRTEVELITIRPEGVGGQLPVCLALHGRGSTARMFLDLEVPKLLNQVMAEGVRPFAVAAVDGGDNYWVARGDDDPQRMLTSDMSQWLANRGFVSTPTAVLGISMGGYGALNYARNPGLTAVAAISAALFTNWPEARLRDAFADEAAWAATEPLRHLDDLTEVPLGVWCGTSDPFIEVNRRLVQQTGPLVADIGPGAHDAPYWQRILPEVLRFVGESIPAR